ncbi:hypothetical protein [Streptomyces sp. NPDC057910]|uniref:hypothetical protein n=1 Tax=Streptomyces sp. NPDC057910 TaxID=3346278 RepID=UPI0036F02A3E
MTEGGPWQSFDAATAEGGIPTKNLPGYAGQGRVVRVEQQLHAPDGSAIKNTLTLRDFGDPTSVTDPG